MNNKKYDIPTLNELKHKVKQEQIKFNSVFELNEKVVSVIINMLENNPDFYKYLVDNNFNDFELTTVVFSEIRYFALEKINIWETEYVEKIFDYLENIINSKDIEIINIIQIGLLETIWMDDFKKMKPYMKESLIYEYDNLKLYWGYGWNK